MELQEFVLKGVIALMRFAEPSPLFADRRGELSHRYRQELGLEHWAFGPDHAELFDAKRTRVFRITSRELHVTFENERDIDGMQTACESFFSALLGELDVEKVASVNVRSHHIAAAENFDELNQWFVEIFSAGASTFFEPLGAAPTDSGWVFEFHKQDPKHNLRVGPMTAEQGMSMVFADQDPDNYPATFALIDLDRVCNDELLPTEDAMKRWTTTFQKNLEAAQKIGRLLIAAT